MEALSLFWDFAPNLKMKLLYLSLVVQIALTIYCYGRMSGARVAAYKENRIEPDAYKATHNEPEDLRVYSRMVTNQFEMPVIFYALVLAFASIGIASWLTVLLAWVFVVFRILHAREMLDGNRVFLRRKLFINSARVIVVMVAEFTLALLFVASF